MELYKEHRPRSFKEVVGQPEAVKVLTDLGKRGAVPHTLLFTGPSGCGKTTLGRILRHKLKCSDIDFHEMNSADFRGIEMVRDIRSRIMLAPVKGKCRVWMIDEAHQITAAAQDAFLKLLEDTPEHVYFMLCTTDPNKLKKTIRTRCTEIKVKQLSMAQTVELLTTVAEREGKTLSEEVALRIAEKSEGGARSALVLLHSVIGIDGEEEQLDALEKNDFEAQAIELARLLMNPRSQWGDVAKVLKNLTDEVETVRWSVLGYCRAIMLKGGKLGPRAFLVIDSFREPFYETKAAGLAAACWEVVNG